MAGYALLDYMMRVKGNRENEVSPSLEDPDLGVPVFALSNRGLENRPTLADLRLSRTRILCGACIVMKIRIRKPKGLLSGLKQRQGW